MTTKSTVLILGASRGLGLAMAEEWLKRDTKVIATQRSASRDLSELQGRYPRSLEIETVDIVEAASVHALRERLGGHRIDVLLTNALGPMRAVELFENLVPANGAIAVMTSELGSIAGNRGSWELYSSSKAALNMLMKCFSARHGGDPRALLLVAPGWTRTDMGTSAATLSIEESSPFVVETVERSRGQAGLRFIDRNGRTLPW